MFSVALSYILIWLFSLSCALIWQFCKQSLVRAMCALHSYSLNIIPRLPVLLFLLGIIRSLSFVSGVFSVHIQPIDLSGINTLETSGSLVYTLQRCTLE